VLTATVILGGVCWSLLIVFFVGQAVAQAAATTPYSLVDNNISDLGVTACGLIAVGDYHAEVCSPWHLVMNATFVAAGLLTTLGALGTHRAWPKRRATIWGLALLALSGAGEILAGLAPEDVHPQLHVLGAIAGIPGVNIGALLLGVAVWHARRWVSIGGIIAGILGLFGFLIAPATAMGAGAAERLAGYPGVVWLIAVGVFLLQSAVRSARAAGRGELPGSEIPGGETAGAGAVRVGSAQPAP
jgi:hypothetical membrane protein